MDDCRCLYGVDVLHYDLPSQPLAFQARGCVQGLVTVKIQDSAFHIYSPRVDLTIPYVDVCGWDLHSTHFSIRFRGNSQDEAFLHLVGGQDVLRALHECFHLARIRHYLKDLSEAEQRALCFRSCPSCHLLVLDREDQKVSYCSECHAMSSQGMLLTVDEGIDYNFCRSGLFERIGPQWLRQRSLACSDGSVLHCGVDEEVQSGLLRAAGHVLWGMLWSLIFFVLWFVLDAAWLGAGLREGIGLILYGLLGLLAAHVVFVGYYLSTLFMTRSISAWCTRSPWQRIARLSERGQCDQAEALMQEHSLDEHPGLLHNLSLACIRAGQQERSWDCLRKALRLCGCHPVLLKLAAQLAPEQERAYWCSCLAKIEQEQARSLHVREGKDSISNFIAKECLSESVSVSQV